jgi:glycosyltransferase involved in cell wall biosynthesis
LLRAVESIAAQTVRERLEIIVVDDSSCGIDQQALAAAALPVPLRRVTPKPNLGQRSSGVEASIGEWIAFLDDDDSWDPRKIELQLQAAREIESRGQWAVISCRIQHTFDDQSRVATGVPARVMADGDSVGRYLFVARDPSVRRACLYTSTLLVSRALALAVPWRRLPRHQDWDWLLRADARDNVVVRHRSEVLATIHIGSLGSISASADWQASLEWAREDARDLLDPRAYADFIAGQVLRYALTARSLRGTASALGELVRNRTIPTPKSLLVGVSGLMPRRGFQWLMSRSSVSKRVRST